MVDPSQFGRFYLFRRRHHGAAHCYSASPTIVVPRRWALATTGGGKIVLNCRAQQTLQRADYGIVGLN